MLTSESSLSPPFVYLFGRFSCKMTMELRVGNKYRLGRKIGSGSFGDIYLGKFLNNLLPILECSLLNYN